MGEDERFTFRFSVLGRYEARLRGNEPHVTVNVAAGHDDHVVYCGTLTMSEAEWSRLADVLGDGLGDDLEIEDHRR